MRSRVLYAHTFIPDIARGRLRWLDFIDPTLKDWLTEQFGHIDFGPQGSSQARERKAGLGGRVVILAPTGNHYSNAVHNHSEPQRVLAATRAAALLFKGSRSLRRGQKTDVKVCCYLMVVSKPQELNLLRFKRHTSSQTGVLTARERKTDQALTPPHLLLPCPEKE